LRARMPVGQVFGNEIGDAHGLRKLGMKLFSGIRQAVRARGGKVQAEVIHGRKNGGQEQHQARHQGEDLFFLLSCLRHGLSPLPERDVLCGYIKKTCGKNDEIQDVPGIQYAFAKGYKMIIKGEPVEYP